MNSMTFTGTIPEAAIAGAAVARAMAGTDQAAPLANVRLVRCFWLMSVGVLSTMMLRFVLLSAVAAYPRTLTCASP